MEVLDHDQLSAEPITLASITHKLEHGIELNENELAHWGVKGMRWGKRKASAQAAVSAAGGHKTGAVVKEVGKNMLTNLLLNVGAASINSLSGNNPSVVKGTAILNGIVQTAVAANTVVNVVAIAKADPRAD